MAPRSAGIPSCGMYCSAALEIVGALFALGAVVLNSSEWSHSKMGAHTGWRVVFAVDLGS